MIKPMGELVNSTVPYAWDDSMSLYEFVGAIVERFNEFADILDHEVQKTVTEQVTRELGEFTEDRIKELIRTGQVVEVVNQAVMDKLHELAVFPQEEIIDARQGKESLGANITEVKSQLAQTVKQGEVTVSDINKNLGKFDETYMTDEFLSQIAGNAPIHSLPPDGGVTTGKLARGAVTFDKLADDTLSQMDFKKSALYYEGNRILKPEFEQGTFVGTGIPVANNTRIRTKDFITPLDKITVQIKTGGYWFNVFTYTQDGVYVSSTGFLNYLYTIPYDPNLKYKIAMQNEPSTLAIIPSEAENILIVEGHKFLLETKDIVQVSAGQNSVYDGVSVDGGLGPNGIDANSTDHGRTTYLPINKGLPSLGVETVTIKDTSRTLPTPFLFLYKREGYLNDASDVIRIVDFEYNGSDGTHSFRVPKGYRYLRMNNKSLGYDISQTLEVYVRTSDAVVINGINLSDTYLSKEDTTSVITEKAKGNLMQIFPKYTTIGDSLTAGFTSVPGQDNIGSAVAVETKNNWPGFLELRTGREFNNIAVGGSTVKDWRDMHLVVAEAETDAYVVALGVNDARQKLTVGTSGDIKTDRNFNADTFYGNYDYLVRELKEYNLNAHVFLFTIPPHESNAETYNLVIRHIANLYEKVHLIDLHNLYYEEYTSGFLADGWVGGHYTPITYNYHSSLIEEALNKYIYNNGDKFKAVPYE